MALLTPALDGQDKYNAKTILNRNNKKKNSPAGGNTPALSMAAKPIVTPTTIPAGFAANLPCRPFINNTEV